jgi:hypothetical protein
MVRWEWLSLAVIMILGAALRVQFLLSAPGFFYDEAIYALDGLSLVRGGSWPLFFSTYGHMREPLFIYLLGLTHLFFEPSVLAARGTATFVGLLTIPVVFLLGREWRGPAAGIAAAALFALMRWHVHFSGLCFRTITSPLMAALVALFFLRFVRTASRRDAIGLGVSLGIGLYSYLSFRLFPIILIPPALIALCSVRGEERRVRLRGFLLAAGVSAVVFAPLGIHFLRNPDHFRGRSDEVTFFNREGAGQLLLQQARDVALMPLFRGDHVGKHNLPGPPRFSQLVDSDPARVAEEWSLARSVAQATGTPVPDPHGSGVPALPLSFGLAFYGGFLLLAIRVHRDPAAMLLLSWLLVGSLASVLSFGAPNMLRMLFLTPAVVMVIVECGFAFQRMLTRVAPAKFAAGGLALLIVTGATQDALRASRWAHHPMVPIEFNADLAALGSFLSAQPDRLPVILPESMGLATHPTLIYVADGYRFIDRIPDGEAAWWRFEPLIGVLPPPQPKTATEGPGNFTVPHPAGFNLGILQEYKQPPTGSSP